MCAVAIPHPQNRLSNSSTDVAISTSSTGRHLPQRVTFAKSHSASSTAGRVVAIDRVKVDSHTDCVPISSWRGTGPMLPFAELA